MVIDGHTLPCYFADSLCKPTTKTPFTLVWFSDDFCSSFTLQDFVGRMNKNDDRYWFETDSFIHSSFPNISDTSIRLQHQRAPLIHTSMHHTHKTHISPFSHVLNFFHTCKHCVAYLNLSILHNIQIFLLHTTKVSICLQDNEIISQ